MSSLSGNFWERCVDWRVGKAEIATRHSRDGWPSCQSRSRLYSDLFRALPDAQRDMLFELDTRNNDYWLMMARNAYLLGVSDVIRFSGMAHNNKKEKMNMTNAIESFNFEGNKTRVVMVDGEPWFCARDVAVALGYSMGGSITSMFAAVPDEWKGSKRIATPGGEQEMLCLSEQGLYFFLGRSDKPAALPYQKTVAGVVMPSIRKHGAYMTPQKLEEVLYNPDLLIGLAQKLKEEQARSAALEAETTALTQKKEALEAKVEADRPKVLFADSVAASDTSILIGNLAKLLRQNGVDIGQNRLFQWMRKNGYLISVKGDRYNMPTQESMDRGLFEIVERTRISPNGNVHIDRTTKVTGKGQVFFVDQFLGGKVADSKDAA